MARSSKTRLDDPACSRSIATSAVSALSAHRRQLVEALVHAGLPSETEATALIEQREPGITWTNTALNSQKLDEQKFLTRLAEIFRVPFMARLDPETVDRDAVKALPSRFVFQHQILPLEKTDTALTLATFDLFNPVARQLAQQLAPGKTLRWVLVPRGPLIRAIKTLYGVGAETFDQILQNQGPIDLPEDRESIAADLNSDDPEASVVKFVNLIIREAIAERATDIHVEPLENDLRIRNRIDGILHETAVPPQLRLLQSAIISRLKVMAHMDIAERRLPQDGRINLKDGSHDIDVRVSTIPTVHGESISLRLLARDEQQRFGLNRLDMSDAHIAMIKTLLAQPNGIILITGPTGSGKSTSLYCFLSSINSVQRRIITIEDPVEYRLPGVSQIEVRAEINLTFANGLRSILRQDPNVVMVGEMRDFETAEIGIRAAMTGHLVFSTLHTNDAVGAITRLLDMGVEPFLVASVVRAFLAQRLVRTVCRHCTEDHAYDPAYLDSIGMPKEFGNIFKRGPGCEQCRHTGYLGRAAIYEICPITERLREEIVHKANGSVLKAVAMSEGMTTLRRDGWRRVRSGMTTVEEVIRVTQEDEALAQTD